MIIFVIVLAAVVIALIRGGRLENLGRLEFRYFYLLFVPLILQLIIFSPLPKLWKVETPAAPFVYAFSMWIGVVVLLLNRHLPGMLLIFFGLLLNLLVIGFNNGYMPVSMELRQMMGLSTFTGVHNNSIAMTANTPLWFLGDLFPLPLALPFSNNFLLSEMFSVGDVYISIGGFMFVQGALVPRPQPPLAEAEDLRPGHLAG